MRYISLMFLALAVLTLGLAPRCLADGVHHFDKQIDSDHFDFRNFNANDQGFVLDFREHHKDWKVGDSWFWADSTGYRTPTDGGNWTWNNANCYDGHDGRNVKTPEPSTFILFLAGLVVLLGLGSLRKAVA